MRYPVGSVKKLAVRVLDPDKLYPMLMAYLIRHQITERDRVCQLPAASFHPLGADELYAHIRH